MSKKYKIDIIDSTNFKITINTPKCVYTFDNRSLIKSERIIVQYHLLERQTIQWSFALVDNKIEIALTNTSDGIKITTTGLDIDKVVEELISNCLDQSQLLDSCKYLNKKINDLYNQLFAHHMNSQRLIYSNMPVNALCVVEGKNDKTVGYASRFVLKENNFILLEYVGEELPIHGAHKVYVNGLKFPDIIMICTNILSHEYDNDLKIGMYNFMSLAGEPTNLENNYEDRKIDTVINYDLLTVPYSIQSPQITLKYIKNNNHIDNITAYKKLLKPRPKLLNVNSIMVTEFCK